VKTRYADGDMRWTVNNDSDELVPRRATLFVDDATIGRCRAGPSLDGRTECVVRRLVSPRARR
jgi:hypothetical protein